MSKPQIDDHDYQEYEDTPDTSIEDLSALLDDALQDFETQKSYNKGKGKPSRSKTGPPSLSLRSLTIPSNTVRMPCQENNNGGRLNDAGNEMLCGSNIASEPSSSYHQKQSTGNSTSIPTEKELEEMFDDLLKSVQGDKQKDDTGESNLDQVLPMMENVMHSLLSADILYAPIKELCNKYPDWLAENRQSLKPTEYDNYNKQYDVARQLCHEFENYQNLKNSRKNITDEMQNSHFEKVFELMQKMQSFGNPPPDIVGDFGAVSNGVGANYNLQEKEEKFKALLEQNGLDSVSGGIQFDAKGMPIFPEELSGTDEKCTIS